MPPSPDLEAEMLTRLMIRFGTTEPQAIAAVAQAAAQPERARVEKGADGVPKLVIDESFDRAWRRVGLALDRSGFTVVDRDRSTGVYYVRYADPDAEIGKKDQGWLAKLAFWRKDEVEKPEQYRITVVEAAPRSLSDMVGHTGVFTAAIKAAETVDACVKRVVEAGLAHGYTIFLTADHGNADFMINEDGSPNTAHTMNPVPFFIIDNEWKGTVKSGKLGDLAPTILTVMGLPIPKEMTGNVLI